MFVICIEAIMYLLLYNLHDCTFKRFLRKEFHSRYHYGETPRIQSATLYNPAMAAIEFQFRIF